MRATRLVADDEFMTQREQLRRKLFEIQASRLNDSDGSLTETEVGELTSTLSDLETAWRTMSVEAKRGFGELVFPAGYVFQKVRTAETGLLFKTFDASDDGKSDLVPEEGVEPSIPLGQSILSRFCMPIPALGQN